MNNYKVVEKFISINGEGSRAGQLAGRTYGSRAPRRLHWSAACLDRKSVV